MGDAAARAADVVRQTVLASVVWMVSAFAVRENIKPY